MEEVKYIMIEPRYYHPPSSDTKQEMLTLDEIIELYQLTESQINDLRDKLKTK